MCRLDFSSTLYPQLHVTREGVWMKPLPLCPIQPVHCTWGPVWSACSHVWLFVTPGAVVHQAPLSMGFSRQEYWNGLPFPSPGDLPHPGIEAGSSALKAVSLPSVPPGKPCLICTLSQTCERNLSYLGKRHPRGMKGIQRKGQQCPSQELAVILCYAVKTVHANWFISDRCLIDWTLNRHTLLYGTSQILLFLNRLKVCGNPVSSKSFGSIFPIVFGHFFVSGSHFSNCHNISKFLKNSWIFLDIIQVLYLDGDLWSLTIALQKDYNLKRLRWWLPF